MKKSIEAYCEQIERPRSDDRPVAVNGKQLPRRYLDILRIANGFVMRKSSFRLFGIDTRNAALDLRKWNESPWIVEYGDLAANIIFFAEDVFGDQYGFRYSLVGNSAPDLVKFWCEGGESEIINVQSLGGWLADSVLCDRPCSWDLSLEGEASAMGLAPSVDEHLSFINPLVVGGSRDRSNLEVMERVFHLHLLGQLSRKNRSLPEGTRIAGFWSEN